MPGAGRAAVDDRADSFKTPTLLIPAHSAIGNTLCFSADFAAARTHAEQLIAIYDPAHHHALAALYSGFDLGVGSHGGLAVNLWALGYPDQAVQRADDAIALARDLSHASSTVLALNWAAMVHQHRREAERTRQHAEAAIALAEEELAPWLAWATMLRGWAMSQQGEGEEGIAQLRRGLAAWSAGGLACLVPYFLSLLSEAQAALGQTDAALPPWRRRWRSPSGRARAMPRRNCIGLRGELQVDPDEADDSFIRRSTSPGGNTRSHTSCERSEA